MNGFCVRCGAALQSDRFCTECGAPVGGEGVPASRRQLSNQLVVLLGVLALLVGVGVVFGVRLLVDPGAPETGGTAFAAAAPGPPPTTIASNTPVSSSSSAPEESSTPVTTSPRSVVTVTSTLAPTTAPSTPATPHSVPGVAVQRFDVQCDGQYYVILASEGTPAAFLTKTRELAQYSFNSRYLYTGSTCLNFKLRTYWALYEGPFPSLAQACAAIPDIPDKPFVKRSDPSAGSAEDC